MSTCVPFLLSHWEASHSPPSSSNAILHFPSWDKAAGTSTAPMSLLTGVKTISSANVDTQKCFQEKPFEKQEQAFTEPFKTCKFLSIPLSSLFSVFPLLFPFFFSTEKSYINNYWCLFFMGFDSILLLKKKSKYKRFLKHSVIHPHFSPILSCFSKLD